jgi:RNA polymerase sigma-70 factor (ECF subfamily)
MEDSDLAVVARVRAGDGDGFRLLVERHSRSVFRLAYRMTGNEQDAEDVVQETFLRAYRQLHRYESRASFGTWLYRIAANYALDLIRSRKHQFRGPSEAGAEASDPLLSVPSSDPGPDRVAFSGQVQQHVAEALDTLTPQERTAFVLRHFEGQSIDEISLALGIGGNAAKHSIFRAVQKLRKALEPLVNAT